MGETRARIMDESLQLFATRGFDGTAVTDIEEASGLAPGSGGFYRHFRSKEAVLRAVLERVITDVRSGVQASPVEATIPTRQSDGGPGAPEPTPDAVAESIERALDGLEERRLWIALLARIHGQFPELEAEVHEVLLSDSRVRSAVGAVPFGDDAASQASATVMASAMVGYHLSQELFGRRLGGLDQAAFAAALAELVMRPGDAFAG